MEYFQDHYVGWRHSRLRVITDYYGVGFFRDKSVLELGCGYGHIGRYFATLGAKVVFLDGRQEYLDCLKRKYPAAETVCFDMNKGWPFQDRQFDVILNMGLVYHLADPDECVKFCCRNCKHLVLETEVWNAPGIYLYPLSEVGYDQSLDGQGSRPTEQYVEQLLMSCDCKFKQCRDPKLNSSFHVYDWDAASTSPGFDFGRRRLWFCENS